MVNQVKSSSISDSSIFYVQNETNQENSTCADYVNKYVNSCPVSFFLVAV